MKTNKYVIIALLASCFVLASVIVWQNGLSNMFNHDKATIEDSINDKTDAGIIPKGNSAICGDIFGDRFSVAVSSVNSINGLLIVNLNISDYQPGKENPEVTASNIETTLRVFFRSSCYLENNNGIKYKPYGSVLDAVVSQCQIDGGIMRATVDIQFQADDNQDYIFNVNSDNGRYKDLIEFAFK